MHEEAKKELRVIFKHSILELASHSSAVKVCQEFNIPSSTFNRWKKEVLISTERLSDLTERIRQSSINC
jgi:hypothetical protein